jgi:transmembrane sensor
VIDPIDDGLLDRYVSGECSQDEIASILQWAGNDPERRARIAHARALSDAVQSLDDHWDVDRAWVRARSVIRSAEPAVRRTHAIPSFDDPSVGFDVPVAVLYEPRARRRPMSRYTFAAAACLVVGVGIAAWRVLTIKRAGVSAPESITTGPRQRVSVQLRDGSRVILGPESRLVEVTQFGTGTREVDLQGAAYFDVVHDSGRPFVVIARNLRIRDLGTRFSVEAYAGDSSTSDLSASASARVAVAAGSVTLQPIGPDAMPRVASSGTQPAPGAPIILHAGSVGWMDSRGHIAVDRPLSISQYVSWTSGTLTLDDVPLGEAVLRLGHWYGVAIRLGDPALACRHITASFHDEPLTDALDELSLALHVRHVEVAGSITLQDPDTRPDGGDQSARQPATRDACAARPLGPAGQAQSGP